MRNRISPRTQEPFVWLTETIRIYWPVKSRTDPLHFMLLRTLGRICSLAVVYVMQAVTISFLELIFGIMLIPRYLYRSGVCDTVLQEFVTDYLDAFNFVNLIAYWNCCRKRIVILFVRRGTPEINFLIILEHWNLLLAARKKSINYSS